MSILIEGLKMPESCYYCPFMDGSWGYSPPHKARCVITGKDMPVDERGVQYNQSCPLVPVPPHGDLIDRDALRASIGESIKECHKWADEVDKDTMMYARISQSVGTFVECSLRAKAAPAIIPAETPKE